MASHSTTSEPDMASERKTELSTSATRLAPTRTADITNCGKAQRTDWLIFDTSDVIRVNRSPLDADSTRPNGRRKTVCTISSRAAASRSYPSTADVRRAANTRADCTSTTTTMTLRIGSTRPADPTPATWSTTRPSIQGTTRPAMAAARFVPTTSASMPLRVRSSRVTNVQAAPFPATGSPRSGLRDPA